MKHLLTLKELAEFLRLSQQTIYKLLKLGRIKGMRIGNQWRFDEDTVRTWIFGSKGRKKGAED